MFEEILPWETHEELGECLWHSETARYVSFSHSWAYNSGDPVYTYNTGTRNACSLISPRITLEDAVSPILTYWDWIETENRSGFDVCHTDITTDGGQNWRALHATSSPTLQWNQRGPFDLSSYRDQIIQIRFRFDTGDSQFNDFEGWYVDDVRIEEGEIPTPTPSPYSGEPGVDLMLNAEVFYETDRFLLEIDYLNPNAAPVQADVYLILDVYGVYWFWPSWTHEIDSASRSMPPRNATREILLDFIWPPYNGTFDGVTLWAAALVPGTSNLIGRYDHVTFGCNL